ncbi:MAG: glycogen synthase [Sphingobacteriia bacterium]|nr:glycogen synthase [Sphingobacteriia bacterium]NCC39114.1 glycogen synthase [Gammaproteobacteria bacterium]
MRIVMVSAECAPIAKAGGLGDVVHGLSRELIALGQDVEIILPAYDALRHDLVTERRRLYSDLAVAHFDQYLPGRVDVGLVDGIRCVFLDVDSPQRFFQRGRIYGEADDAARFAVFCQAALAYLRRRAEPPDIIHGHDWQTALVPVLLFEQDWGAALARARVCYSLHNVGYQGLVEEVILRQVGLDPARVMTPDRLQDPANPRLANLMKGGIVYSNFVNTVSPRYAWEVQHTEQGMGLQALLRHYDEKFAGVLNGIDETVWSPASDPHLPAPFDQDRLPAKLASRRALRQRFGLAESDKPILILVSRLDHQKGVHLIRFGIQYVLAHGGQVVLLGSALDERIAEQFRQLQAATAEHPDCRLVLAYDEQLAHLMYGGGDMILIPSVYEPCGLTQMIAMKYGVVPIARRVGGLADTIVDANYSTRPFSERTGYLFDDLTEEACAAALERALGLWRDHPAYFRQLRVNGMRIDHSWRRPAHHYLDIYAHIRVL